jgi:hypothetical protein
MKRSLLALAWLAVFLPLRFALAQPAPQSSGKYSIRGVVVSAATGQPLDRADVTLQTSNRGTQVAETTTGQDGRFVFEHLAAGKYSLLASRRGYLTAAYEEHEGFSTAIVTGEGLTADGLVFRLPPRAVIKGTVTDEAGDQVQQARVSLYRQNLGNGLGNIVRAAMTVTDDTGAYEFARLEAGNYFVAVSANPWYATRPQEGRDAEGNLTPNDQRSPLDVAYPVTFYADVTDSDSATPIPVKAGDQVQVNFTMHAVPAIHLSVQIPAPSGRGFAMPQLDQDIFGTTDRVQASVMRGGQGGDGEMTMEFEGVAPGHYSLESRGGGDASHSASIDAASDTRIDLSQAGAMADVSGKVVMAGGEKLPDRLNISLRSSDGRRNLGGEQVGADGSFSLHGIPPGSYEVWANAQGVSVAVIQMTSTGAATEGHMLKVGSQPVAISATLAEGSTTVTGFAKRDGKPAEGAMVLLAPKNPGADREMFRRDQSDSDGSFSLRQAVPGDYTVVAIEDGWVLDWARPEVIAHYLAKGLKVTVPPHAKDFAIKDAIEVQPK